MASISSLGIGSGLDLSTLLDKLTTAEQAQLTPITTQQTAYNAKLTAYSTLKSALTAFQTANTALANSKLYQSSTATSSAPSSFTATTDSGATAGNYAISISQLAQAQSLTSAKYSSTTSNIGTSGASNRSLSISLAGSSSPVNISLSDSQTTLTGVRDAINAANAGVNASIIQVDSGNYQLVLASASTGTSNGMTISVSGDDALQSALGYDASSSSNGLTQTVAAQNAKLTVNGVAIERSSNTITDAPSGVTLSLLGTTTSTQNLSVAQDNSAVSTAITNWVSAYNSLQTTISSLTAYTPVNAGSGSQSSKNGALLGDSTVRSIQMQLKAELTNSSSTSTLKTLAQIGITQDPTTGQLSTDSTKLSSALSTNMSGVKAMIIGDGKTTGITTTIGTSLSSYVSSKGILTAATNGVNATLKGLSDQYDKTNDRITTTIALYKTKFSQLDVLMNSLNSTSTYLKQQFSSSSSDS